MQLGIELSKLENFGKINVKLEQYATPSEIAADWLWNAKMKGDIEGKVILDAACGPGILGCGALLLGAKKVYFLDKSTESIAIAKRNVFELEKCFDIGKSEFLCQGVEEFNNKVDTILQNPPFGTKVRHHDKLFLETAFKVGQIVYSMHKKVTARFVEAMAKDCGFMITEVRDYDFRLKATLPWHRKKAFFVKAAVWRMVKSES